MKLTFRYILFVLILIGCSSNAEVTDKYSYWKYGFTAPAYYQIKTEYLQAKMPDGNILHLMAGPTLGGNRPDSGVGDQLEPHGLIQLQNKYTELPDSMVVSWFSYAEKQFYAANIHFSANVKKQMMTPYISNCWSDQRKVYHNEIVIGLAPGGYVKVWGTGGCRDQAILVGKFKGWKMKESLTGNKPESFKESTEAYQKEFADILAKPIPYDNWK